MNHEMIKEIVEDFYKLKIDSNTRQRKYVEARAIYYKLLRDNSRMSLEAIGKTMNRNHATALYSLKNIEDWLEYDEQLKQDYETLNKRVEHAAKINPDFFTQAVSIEGYYEIEYKKLEEKHNYIVNNKIAEALVEEAKKYNTLARKYNFLKSLLKRYEPKRIANGEFDLV
jgi:hypothetical protein